MRNRKVFRMDVLHPYIGIGLAIALPLLVPALEFSGPSMLIAHTLLETMAIVLCAMIFVVGWMSTARGAGRNVIALSSLFLSLALLSFAHMLSYPGMPFNVFSDGNDNASEYWYAARLLTVLAFVCFTTMSTKPYRSTVSRFAGLGFGLLFTGLVFWIVAGTGDWTSFMRLGGPDLSVFKRYLEIGIIAVYAASAVFVYNRPRNLETANAYLFYWALMLIVTSEVMFSMYDANLLSYMFYGHIFKTAAFILVFRALFWDQIRRPYAVLLKSETEVRGMKDRLYTTLESIYDAVIISDSQGQVTFINPAASALLGNTEKSALSKPVEEVFRSEDAIHPVRRCMIDKSSVGVQTGQVCALNDAGRLMSVEYSVSPIIYETGELMGAVLVFRDISERIEADKVQRRLVSIIEETTDFIATASAEGQVLYYNRTARTMLGLTEDEDVSAITIPITHPKWAADLVTREGLPHAAKYGIWSGETAFLGKSGEETPVSQVIMAHKNDQGEVEMFSTIARSLAEMRMADKKDRLATRVFESIAEGIMVTDNNQVIQYVNPSFTAITGYQEREIVGSTPRMLSSGKHSRDFYQAMWTSIREHGRWSGEIWNKRKNGEIYLEDITVTAVHNHASEVDYYVGVFKDITLQKQLEARIQYQAYHDTVTGLPNRVMLHERLAAALVNAERNQTVAAVLFLDLDRFKRINDTLGHTVGDQLLKAVSERLSRCLRDTDTIARIGGDEFVVLLPELSDGENSAVIAQKIILALTSPFYIGWNELYVSVSVGISHYPADGDDPDTLIKHADQAMYKAKEQGRNNYQVYTPGDESKVLSLPLEVSLRRAILGNELEVYYQPQFSLSDDRTVGVEALVRWFHPDWGAISPAQFIPLAEETGLIALLDQWVLSHACKQGKAWLDQGLSTVRISVNMSMVQFRQPHLDQYISQILQDTGLPAGCLEIELTESTLMSNPEVALRTINRLKAMGIGIALDDFGIGYSSLNYLKQLPIDRIKIDQSFVRDIQHDAGNQAIVQTIIQLSRNMRLSVIAEGVEDEAELAYLHDNGCEEIQGFYFSRPLSREDATSFLKGKMEMIGR